MDRLSAPVEHEVPILHPEAFAVRVLLDGMSRVVEVTGELDGATGGELYEACVQDGSLVVVVDLVAVTFMDCGGFHNVESARDVLVKRGGSLTLRNQAGQPARLLEMHFGEFQPVT